MGPLSSVSLEKRSYYRADIDGLRGGAVAVVVGYHFAPSVLKYGYLGVDVFFVVSGYVVTQAFIRDAGTGWSSLVGFYARRARRILPALVVNLVITAILACVLIPPTEVLSLVKTAAAAALGASNVALWISGFDYFGVDPSLNPFVHTWSLGVEEQFYLVLPAMLLLVRHRGSLVGALLVASLAYWISLGPTSSLQAFYSPVARCWELLVGVLLALPNTQRLVPWNSTRVGGAIGVLCVAVSLAIGGAAAHVLVVVGTALLIVQRPTWLLNGTLVGLGRISYSVYLWHYSGIVLAGWVGPKDAPSLVAAALAWTVIASWLSFRFVETPWRYSRASDERTIAIGLASVCGTLLVIAAIYWLPPSRLYLGDSERYTALWPATDAPLSASIGESARNCHLEYRDNLEPSLFERCATARLNRSFLYLVGNSHAQHLVPMAEGVSRLGNVGYSATTISNCRMSSGLQVVPGIQFPYELCQAYFKGVLRFVSDTARAGDVVVVGARSLVHPPSPFHETWPSNTYDEGGVRLTQGEAFSLALAGYFALADVLNRKGVHMVLMGPTPAFEEPAARCAPEWFRIRRPGCHTTIGQLEGERAATAAVAGALKSRYSNVTMWEPAGVLCRGDLCSAYSDGELLYRDRHHLSIWGAQALAPAFTEFISTIHHKPIV